MSQIYVIGRITADLELKTSANGIPYARFELAEKIGRKEHMRTQYLQICAIGDDAKRIAHARVRKGSLIWISGSLEFEKYTNRDGSTIDKNKVLLDNWGFVPVSADKADDALCDESSVTVCINTANTIDGDKEILPG